MTSKIREAVVSIGLSLALGLALPAVALADEAGDLETNTTPIEQQENSDDEQVKETVNETTPAGDGAEAQAGTETPSEPTSDTDDGADETTDTVAGNTEATPVEQPKNVDESSDVDDDTDATDAPMQLMADPDENADGELEDEPVETGRWETTDDGKTYYYNASGERVRWSQTIDGQRYYFNGEGVMQTGWITFKQDNTRSYFDPSTGAAVTGWKDIAKKTYFFRSDYRAARYSNKLTGKDGNQHDYYFNGLGEMFTGLLTWSKDSTKSFFENDKTLDTYGAAVIKWRDVSGKTYYFNPSNLRAVRYSQKLTGKDGKQHDYYFNGAGVMQTGFVTWSKDKTKSYFDPSTGAAVTGWKDIAKKTYYFHPSTLRAARYSNTLTGRDGKKHDYYFSGAGVMTIGVVEWKSTGTASLFDAEGAKVLNDGWVTINSDKYYVRSQSPVRWRQTIGGKKYYFNGSYKMHRGWLYFSSTKTWSYFDDTTGVESNPQPGWSITGGKYYFYTPDKQLTTWNKDTYESWNRIKSKSSDTKYLISVNLDTCYMNVFQKSGSIWVPIKGWMVSVGNDEAGCATPTGTRKTTGQKNYYWPADGDNCAWYATVFLHEPGRWTAFHSVIYKDGSLTKIKDPRLGYHITGSCVRMEMKNAIWVYDNIGKGTTVHIY